MSPDETTPCKQQGFTHQRFKAAQLQRILHYFGLRRRLGLLGLGLAVRVPRSAVLGVLVVPARSGARVTVTVAVARGVRRLSVPVSVCAGRARARRRSRPLNGRRVRHAQRVSVADRHGC